MFAFKGSAELKTLQKLGKSLPVFEKQCQFEYRGTPNLASASIPSSVKSLKLRSD